MGADGQVFVESRRDVMLTDRHQYHSHRIASGLISLLGLRLKWFCFGKEKNQQNDEAMHDGSHCLFH